MISPVWTILLTGAATVAEILLFHHALGLTSGVREFADELRNEGHTVHIPDLFEGKTFTNVDDGVAYAQEVGFETILDKGVHAADGLPSDLVYAGFSLGVMPAQSLAQSRPGARGALFFYAAMPVSEFGGGAWPEGLPLQIHVHEEDELGDVDIARELAASISSADLFLYPGDSHLFADNSTADYDADAARLAMSRVVEFLRPMK